jgi:hypothetical protein
MYQEVIFILHVRQRWNRNHVFLLLRFYGVSSVLLKICCYPSSSRNGICLQGNVNALLIGRVFDFVFSVCWSFLARNVQRLRNRFCPRSRMQVFAVLILIFLSISYLNSVRRNLRHACDVIGLRFSFFLHSKLWSSREQLSTSLWIHFVDFLGLSLFAHRHRIK